MLAFLLILLPLLVLAWQAWQSLNALSDQAALVNRTTLIDARRSEAMTNAALEMERSYRQYCVLDDPTLAKVYQSQRKRYSEMLDAHAGVLPDDKLYQALRQDLNNLAQLQCNNSGPDAAAAARLEAFASANTEMVQATRTVVFSRGQQLQREIAERGQYFGWQSLVLFLVSLVMVLLFTRMIIGPVKNIERMINRLGEGRSLGNSVSFSGPSELRSVGQRILWLSERLSWLESQRHQFLRHLSHELKTPMSAIIGSVEILQKEGIQNKETFDEFMGILLKESYRMQNIIEDILELSRLEQPRVTLSPKLINVDSIVKDTVELFEPLAKDKHLSMFYQTKVSNELMLDYTTVKTILNNLVSNAIKYSNSGVISIKAFSDKDKLTLIVQDEGVGISKDDIPLIYERFFQVDRSRSKKMGTGLGLSIVKRMVELNNGTISVESDQGIGSVFTVVLPILGE